MAALVIALGLVMIAWGITSWIGWLPTVRRTSMFWGGVHPDLVVMGLGVMLIGSTGYVSVRELGWLGAALVVAGAVLWVLSPSWLVPRWYKERYPQP